MIKKEFRIIFLSLAIIFLSIESYSQVKYDTVSYAKTLIGYDYFYQGQLINRKELKKIVKECPTAKKTIRITTFDYYLSRIIGFSGALLLSLQIEEFIDGGNPNWILGAAGGAIAVTALPFYLWEQKKHSKSRSSI